MVSPAVSHSDPDCTGQWSQVGDAWICPRCMTAYPDRPAVRSAVGLEQVTTELISFLERTGRKLGRLPPRRTNLL